MKKETLDARVAEMKERQQERNREYKRKERLRKRLEKNFGAEVNIEVIRPGDPSVSGEVKAVLARLVDALKSLEGLTPEQIHMKVTALTQLLHVKLQLQVNDSMDKLNSGDPDIRDEALNLIRTLMPFITQITELNVKMQAVLGLNENKGKLTPKRQDAVPSTSPEDWEKSFSDTLTNKSLPS